jgi:hypothetical protein
VGGVVIANQRAGKVILTMGDTGQSFGVFAELPDLGQLIPLTVPLRLEVKPIAPNPPKSSAPHGPPAKSS